MTYITNNLHPPVVVSGALKVYGQCPGEPNLKSRPARGRGSQSKTRSLDRTGDHHVDANVAPPSPWGTRRVPGTVETIPLRSTPWQRSDTYFREWSLVWGSDMTPTSRGETRCGDLPESIGTLENKKGTFPPLLSTKLKTSRSFMKNLEVLCPYRSTKAFPFWYLYKLRWFKKNPSLSQNKTLFSLIWLKGEDIIDLFSMIVFRDRMTIPIPENNHYPIPND